MRACPIASSRLCGRYGRRWVSPGGLKRCTGVGTGSRPRADRTEVDRLLHELRSTLARLKAEVELLAAAGDPALRGPHESLTEAFDLIAALESSRERGERLILVLDDD